MKISCLYKVYGELLTYTTSTVKFDFTKHNKTIVWNLFTISIDIITTINNNQLDKCTINKNLWGLKIEWAKIIMTF